MLVRTNKLQHEDELVVRWRRFGGAPLIQRARNTRTFRYSFDDGCWQREGHSEMFRWYQYRATWGEWFEHEKWRLKRICRKVLWWLKIT